MVLQGSAKGQARAVEEKGGEEDRYYGLLKDTVLTPQPFRLKQESKCCCLSPNINTNQHEGVKQQHLIHRFIKLFWTEAEHSIMPKEILKKVKIKGWKRQLKLMSLVREEATSKHMRIRVLRQTLWHSVMYIHSSKFQVQCFTSYEI